RAMLVQAIVTGLSVLPFAALGYAVFRRRDVALVSTLIASLFVPFAAYGSVLFAEALFVALIAASFALLPYGQTDALSRRRLFLAGVLLGLATLTRAVGLFFIPILVLALIAEFWKNREQRTENKGNKEASIRFPSPAAAGEGRQAKRDGVRALLPRDLSRILLGSWFLVLGSFLVIAPWTLRNALAYDRLIAVDTNGGISFWYGAVRSDAELAAGEAQLAALPNLADKQRAALALAFDAIAADPGHYLSNVRYKIVSLWQLGSRNYAAGGIISFDPDGYSLGQTPGELPLPLSLLADAQYVLLVLGGIWGYCFAPRESRSVVLLLWLLFGTLMSGITIGHPRLRLPLLVAFVPYAAWCALMLPSIVRSLRARWRTTTIAVLVTLAFAGVIFTQQYARWARALLTVKTSDQTSAATYRQAYAINPANPLWLLAAADWESRSGNWAQAEQDYQQAVEQDPRSLYAHVSLIQAAFLRGDERQAQQHLAAIQALGRDNNDLLLWAWSRFSAYAATTIQPTQPGALGMIQGFVPTQPGSDERWTMGTAQLRLEPSQDCGQISLTLRGHQPNQPLDVEVGGRFTTINITTERSVYHVPLEAGLCQAGNPLLVTLRTRTRVLDADTQPWPVGVAVAQVSLE
ncbi:MAG: phospholipid carrier-dependent glycosyltransferase, partial [Chloroflexi bacterium]|nr:phospholipid carrier-dependent glycosyltransferase [Chloroflexota bacterium]